MVKETGFYALLSRMRYISRWGLMRSSIPENVQEHSHETAVYAHALGIIRREIFGQECDAERLAVLAVYHDASEILTGDLPTPIKYHDRTLRDAYKKVEHAADERLLAMLPEELRGAYESAFTASEDEEKLVKAADKLSALRQCIEERKAPVIRSWPLLTMSESSWNSAMAYCIEHPQIWFMLFGIVSIVRLPFMRLFQQTAQCWTPAA